ncbi:MAG: dienelactone hydrolase family protein [Xanthomonadaceae bacterium]|nr:dienelactone hydrolase family protein [Xanthomonadaceae bacterium]
MRPVIAMLALFFLGATTLAHAAMRTQTIEYSVDGKAMQGVLLWDDAVKTSRPGLLMVPDWTGINPVNIDFAKTIAGKDYVIFMGDMYGKDLRPKDSKEAQAAVKPLLSDRPMLRKRVAVAFAELKALAAKHAAPIDVSKLAAIGFCFGGTSVLDLARSGSDVAAVVSFHGGLATDDPALAKNIKARVLAMNGADDRGTMPDAPAFMKEMQQSPAPWQFVAFGGAVHCFAEPQAHSPPGCVYDPPVAKRAFALMHAWLDETFAGRA